jgi:hypothetical protein
MVKPLHAVVGLNGETFWEYCRYERLSGVLAIPIFTCRRQHREVNAIRFAGLARVSFAKVFLHVRGVSPDGKVVSEGPRFVVSFNPNGPKWRGKRAGNTYR